MTMAFKGIIYSSNLEVQVSVSSLIFGPAFDIKCQIGGFCVQDRNLLWPGKMHLF